jgi:hypothetical protein
MTLSFLKRLLMQVTVISCFCVIGYPQVRDRIIEKESWRSEPIRIVKLRTKSRDIELRKKFEADDDWLRGFTAIVQNVSDKAIARVVLQLGFPRPDGSSENEITYTTRVTWGQDPRDLKNEPLNLMQPGEQAEAKLVEAKLPTIKSDLRALGYSDKIDRVRLLVDSIIFADGSMWKAGEVLYPDPSDPTRWINPKSPPSKRQSSTLFRTTSFAASAKQSALLFQLASFDRYSPNWRNGVVLSLPAQAPPTVPCTTKYNFTYHVNCGETGSGCSFIQNNFSDEIQFLGERNARKQLSSTKCEKSDGTECSPQISVSPRLYPAAT